MSVEQLTLGIWGIHADNSLIPLGVRQLNYKRQVRLTVARRH